MSTDHTVVDGAGHRPAPFRPDLYAPGGVIRTIFELDEPCVGSRHCDGFSAGTI